MNLTTQNIDDVEVIDDRVGDLMDYVLVMKMMIIMSRGFEGVCSYLTLPASAVLHPCEG